MLKSGEQLIVYDPRWYGGITSTAARFMVLGHEIGHHVCGHTVGLMQENPWQKELEADRYAGSAIKRVGYVSMQEVIEAAQQVYQSKALPHIPRWINESRPWCRVTTTAHHVRRHCHVIGLVGGDLRP